MSTRRFEVIGEHSAPQDFEKDVYDALKNHDMVHITAKETTRNDLAARRGVTVDDLEFDFKIENIHTGPRPVFGGHMFTNDIKGRWIQIEVTADNVQFNLLEQP